METQVRVSPAERTIGASMPISTRRSTIQSPDRPPTIPAAVTRAPSAAAARAALRPLPPGRATTTVGRWIAPWVRRSTS
jgi:hypothetical protein